MNVAGNFNEEEDNIPEHSEQASAQHHGVQQEQEQATTILSELVTTLRLAWGPYNLTHIWHSRMFQVAPEAVVQWASINLIITNFIIQVLARIAVPQVFSSLSCSLDGTGTIQGWVYQPNPSGGEVHLDNLWDVLNFVLNIVRQL